MDNPTANHFLGRVMCFDDTGQGDLSSEDNDCVFEVTEAGNGFVEIAFDDRNERCYIAFRVSDLLRSIKEHN